MKKILLITGCVLTFMQAKAQVALTLLNDTPITNGQVFVYNSTEYPANTLYYKIKNTSANPISVRFKIVGLTNNNGSGFQVCYDPNCIPFVSLNQVFPPNSQPPIAIAANGSTTGDGYNMANFDAGTGTFPLDYVVKFFTVDATNVEVGTPFTVTYRYDPNAMGVNNVNAVNDFAKVLNTKVGNSVQVSSKEKGQYQIHNAEGKLILSGNIATGNNQIDMSSFKNGVYFISIKNAAGITVNSPLLK